jgi:hypothetical protein
MVSTPGTAMETERSTRIWPHLGMLVSTALLGVVVAWLLMPAFTESIEPALPPAPAVVPRAVHADPGGAIEIADDSPLQSHLVRVHVESARVHFPALTVGGSILARITSGSAPLADRWQFSSSEMAGKYADWLKAKSEGEFASKQLAKSKALVTAQTGYLSTNVKRLEPAAKSGSITEKELRAAQADLAKAELQGDKDIFSAETALRLASQTKSALDRDLSQGGIDAEVLERAVEHLVLIVANVPESSVSRVREGQESAVHFYAYPDRVFPARISTLSPLLTRERRTMRVLLEINDPDGALRPGMFAEVDLGIDERDAILIPAEALLHCDDTDYVIVATETGRWKPVAVRVGAQHAGTFEVLKGLHAGETIITGGAILLKPAVIETLRRPNGEKI